MTNGNDIIDYALIQVQDLNGNWITARTVNKVTHQYLLGEMQLALAQFGLKRVKAIDKMGRLLEIL